MLLFSCHPGIGWPCRNKKYRDLPFVFPGVIGIEHSRQSLGNLLYEMSEKLLKKTDLRSSHKGNNKRQQMRSQWNGMAHLRQTVSHCSGGALNMWINTFKSHSCFSFRMIVTWHFKALFSWLNCMNWTSFLSLYCSFFLILEKMFYGVYFMWYMCL